MSSCEDCGLRKKYDENPRSLLGRIWRWHTSFCPGWKKYFADQSDERKAELARKYDLKTR